MVMKRENKRRKGLLPDPLDPLDGGGGRGGCLPDPVQIMVFASSLSLAMVLLFHDALIE